MPIGLQIWNSSNQLILDYTDPVGKFLGSFDTNGNQSGSFTDSDIIGKTVFHYPVGGGGDYGGPRVTANTSTGLIQWEYTMQTTGGASTPPYPDQVVYYGVY